MMREMIVIIGLALMLGEVRGEVPSLPPDASALAQQIDRIHLRRVHVGEPSHAALFQQFLARHPVDRDILISALKANLEKHRGKNEDHHVVCFFGALNRLAELRAVEAASAIRGLTRDADELVRHRGVRTYVLIGPDDLASFAESIFRKTDKSSRREREVLYRALVELSQRPTSSNDDGAAGRRRSVVGVQPQQLLEAARRVDPDPVNRRLLDQFIAKNREGSRRE